MSSGRAVLCQLARATCVGLVLFGSAAGLPVAAQPSTASAADGRITLDFVNAEIEAVARTIATISGHNVVVDPRVQGTMTLTSTTPITATQALHLFEAQLRTQGFALVSSDGMDIVVPESEAKLRSAAVSAGQPLRSGQIQTQIFRLTHEDANNLVPILRPLISPNNTINASPEGNALVITDYGDNLQRLARIIATLDVSEATGIEIVHLQHAVASDLAPLVERLLDSGTGPGSSGQTVSGQQVAASPGSGGYRTTLVPEPRSNAIIVRAANPARLVMAKSLIQQLDQPASVNDSGDGGNIHVVYLKNSDATRLATTLRAALDALPGREDRPGSGDPGASLADHGSGGLSAGGSSPDGFDSGPTIDVATGNQPSTGGQIQADPSTNSLIISAPPPVYRELRAVIDKLDQRRAQVYVESLIAEVRADKMAELGVQWQGILGNRGDRNVGVIGTNYGDGQGNILVVNPGLNDLITNQRTPAQLPINQGFNFGIMHRFGSGYLLSALANFIQTSGAGNVLSTPTLLTLDNEEARIVVGKNVPLVTGSYTNTGSATNQVNPFQTFERKDVGLTLRVRPQISENGSIKMVIYQEVSNVDPSSIGSEQGLITNKRAIESSIIVDDGATVVLGGLLEDSFTTSEDKIPGLGDIPVMGNLFKSQNRSHVKTNLMVFLRPVIVRDGAAAEGFSLSRYDYMRALQEGNQPSESLLLPSQAPVMPPMEPGDPEAWNRPAAPEPMLDARPSPQDQPFFSEPADDAFPASGENSWYGG